MYPNIRDQSGLWMGFRILIFESCFGKVVVLFESRLGKAVAQFGAGGKIELEMLCWNWQ